MEKQRTACDRLVARLVSYGHARGMMGRWCVARRLFERVYEGYRRGEATRALPVDGIRRELVAHGQGGQLYRHLHFHIGCRFLGWPGRIMSWAAHRMDVKQASLGRPESEVEMLDNEVAWACAEVLLERSRRRISRQEAAAGLRGILGERESGVRNGEGH